MFALKPEDFIIYLKKVAKVIEENKEYITELDSETGDGDHWLNMNIGFQKLVEKTGEWKKTVDRGPVGRGNDIRSVWNIERPAGPTGGKRRRRSRTNGQPDGIRHAGRKQFDGGECCRCNASTGRGRKY